MRNHLDENFGELLSHGFMGDVARWFLEHANTPTPSEDVRSLLSVLEAGLANGPPDVQELISVSFVENLPVPPDNHQALAHLGPNLKADYFRWTGISL
jgi:hypothetical protein